MVFSVYSRFRAFQHTATRRWLLGGYLLINQTGNVSTHSHPKVAAPPDPEQLYRQLVSTHSHPKVAASWPVRALIIWVCFNTQPPEGGCSAAADAPVPVEPEPPKPDKPKKRKPSAARIELEAYRVLGEHGIDGQLAQDYIALRKSHRAPITQTALKGIEREANSAGLSLEQALTICCERGWRGFRAEWLHSAQPKPNRINTVPQHTNGGAHLAKDIL